MPDDGERRVPESPDDARDQQRGDDAQMRGHLRHEVAAPAPFLAERREDVEHGRQEDGERQLCEQHHGDGVGGQLRAGRRRLLLRRGDEGAHGGVEVLGEHEEVHGRPDDGQDGRPEPGNREPRQRLLDPARFDDAVLESLPRDEARDEHADGGEEHGRPGDELRGDRRDAGERPR